MDDLINVADPAWPVLQEELAGSSAAVYVIPGDPERGRHSLLQLQVTARSYLGALVLYTGGLVVDGGWLRVFGGPGGPLPGIAQVNRFPPAVDPGWQSPGGLIVGCDVVGGVFALNGIDPASAGRPGAPGQMLYFAPESLEWEPLEVGYSAWVSWLLSGQLAEFYGDLRWPGWEHETRSLQPSQGIGIYPPLCSEEGMANLAATTRRPVPMTELVGMSVDFCRQFGQRDPGFLGVY